MVSKMPKFYVNNIIRRLCPVKQSIPACLKISKKVPDVFAAIWQ